LSESIEREEMRKAGKLYYVRSMRLSEDLIKRIDMLTKKGIEFGHLPRDIRRSQMIRHLLNIGLTTLEK
jgi:hypothetical protein